MKSTSERRLRALRGGQYDTKMEARGRGHPVYVVRRDGVMLAEATSKSQAWALALSAEMRSLRAGNDA